MSHEQLGRLLLGIGLGIAVVGLLLTFGGGWLGRLPGDLSFRKENFRVFFPFTTLLLLNALFWGVMKIVSWFRDRP